MTRAERSDLLSLVKARARVAKSDAEARKAELLADFEAQLATEYDRQDERWAEAERRVGLAMAQLNADIRQVFDDEGVHPRFRPKADVHWWPRGENVSKERRAELRKVATSRLDAQARQAKAMIDAASVDAQTRLIADGLTTDAARRFLEDMPTPETLMPGLRLDVIEAAADEGGRP
jgi:hypothetical protein